MRYWQIMAATVGVASCFAGSPAWAQQAPATSAQPNASSSPGADKAFLLGLRRIGVVAGHAVACAPEGQREPVVESASDLATEIAVQFGLNAAFHFMGAVGYGSGHPFDKAICAQAAEDWKAIQQKYAAP